MDNKNRKPYISYIETHLVEHCNLKCNYCAHFSHIVNEKIYTDIIQYRKDIKTLGNKINIVTIRLLGGEPLLHPDINSFMEVTREAYSNSKISIVTNGILLPQMKKKFWETLKEYRIGIDLTKYPILNNKFSYILDLCADNGINYVPILVANKFSEANNPKGDSDMEETWNKCVSKLCLNLWKQQIFYCQNCYKYYYNQKFNKNIPFPPSVDIYSNTGDDIIKLLKKYHRPFEACKYCKPHDKEVWHSWEKLEF